MCGLVGFNGNKKPNIVALKLMSIINRDRGKDSVGFRINNITNRGIYENYQKDFGDPLAFFSKFTFNKSIIGKWTSNSVMIHNRSATRGLRTIENSHPFVYEKDGVTHYFCHNGTLTNETELCKIYGLNPVDFSVDSKLLGHIIVHHGFEVLKQYKGAAAFLYYRNDMPNSLFVFKGESLSDGKLEEERPLFYIRDKSSIYLASTQAALECALDAPVNSSISLITNTVIKFTDGVVEEQTFFDRSNIENKPPVVKYEPTVSYNNYHKPKKNNDELPGCSKNDNPKLCLYNNHEKNPQGKAGNKIYYYKGLYYKNGHYLSGVYAVKEDGFVNDNVYYQENVPMFRKSTGDCEFETYYFHFGFWIKDLPSYLEVKEIVKTREEMFTRLHKILRFLHDDYYLFFYEYSELKGCNVLKVYNRSALMYAEIVSKAPKFSLYNYKFLIRENKYIVTLLKNEVIQLPATTKTEEENNINNVYTNHPWQEMELF